LSDKIFTNKSNYLVKWWEKIVQQANDQQQEPLLFFKYTRSKVYVCTINKPSNTEKYLYISWLDCYIALAEEWLDAEKVRFLND